MIWGGDEGEGLEMAKARQVGVFAAKMV